MSVRRINGFEPQEPSEREGTRHYTFRRILVPYRASAPLSQLSFAGGLRHGMEEAKKMVLHAILDQMIQKGAADKLALSQYQNPMYTSPSVSCEAYILTEDDLIRLEAQIRDEVEKATRKEVEFEYRIAFGD